MSKAEMFLKQVYSTADQSNCSGFLKEVARKLDILGEGKPIPDVMANEIIDYIASHADSWVKIGQGPNVAFQAAAKADGGYLVIALLKGKDHTDHRVHGHVAIVLPPPILEEYPRVICAGSESGRSDGSKAVYASNYHGVWKKDDALHVSYYRSSSIFALLTDSPG